MKKSKVYILIGVFILSCVSWAMAYPREQGVGLSKQILEAKNSQEAFAGFEAAKQDYFNQNKYNEFIEFLNSLAQKKKELAVFVNYYKGLTRYQQLKFLEEKQNWDEYFSRGNDYRDELAASLKESIKATQPSDKINVYSRLVLWQFHEDQQDAFAEQSLIELSSGALEYAKSSFDLIVVKEVADKLLSYSKQGPAKELYKIYIDKIAAADIKVEELKTMAEQFVVEGNLELAQTVYDVYIDRIVKTLSKEKAIAGLIEIARYFVYKDEGPKDVFYAEKVFKKIEELGAKDAFDEDLCYLRAFNLEKAKEFTQTKDLYILLLNRFPDTKHADEANYKIGIIFAYVLRDIQTAKGYFEKLAQKEIVSPQVISSLYHLGLLYQWQDDFAKAKDYYLSLIRMAKNDFAESTALAKERIKEIEEAKALDYNLKIFLDVSLKEEYASFNMSKVDLKSSLYRPKKHQKASISSLAYPPESGCMQVVLDYLWSGDLGKAQPAAQEAAYTTSYSTDGTKVIFLLVTTPSGVIDRNIDLLDVE